MIQQEAEKLEIATFLVIVSFFVSMIRNSKSLFICADGVLILVLVNGRASGGRFGELN